MHFKKCTMCYKPQQKQTNLDKCIKVPRNRMKIRILELRAESWKRILL